jgi:hypothetical protein
MSNCNHKKEKEETNLKNQKVDSLFKLKVAAPINPKTWSWIMFIPSFLQYSEWTAEASNAGPLMRLSYKVSEDMFGVLVLYLKTSYIAHK